MAESPEISFSGKKNKDRNKARIAELEMLLDQAHAENELLKRALAMGGKGVRKIQFPLLGGVRGSPRGD